MRNNKLTSFVISQNESIDVFAYFSDDKRVKISSDISPTLR